MSKTELSKTELSKSRYSTDKVIKLQGKDYILFQGILECAHEYYELKTIDTSNIIQLPTKENGMQAIIHAKVETKDGRVFTGTGDADPTNVHTNIKKHLIRMAETRAVGRALRFLTGFGTLFEELDSIEDLSSAPIETKPTPSKEEPVVEKATSAQLRKIQKDSEALGLSEEDIKKKALLYPDISKEEAKQLIKWLKETKENGITKDAPF
jgi:hypothetical protein